MRHSKTNTASFAALTLLTLSLTAALPSTVDAQVRDDGGFFSAEAVSRANQTIDRIKREHNKGLVIETYPNIPPNLRDEFQRMNKDQFYGSWVDARARALGLDGAFVLMTKDPGRVQVGVGKATRDQEFTVADREQLREMMAAKFRSRDFDGGLLQGVEFVYRRIGENAGP